ncbi:MAG: HAD hydrolase-like protein [Porticoccaceae bacterium]
MDVGGGQAAGRLGILVKTGKYRHDCAAAFRAIPDAVIDSVTDLPLLLV